MSKRELVKKACEQCGKVMHGVDRNQLFCAACAEDRRRKRKAGERAACKSGTAEIYQPPRKRKHGSSLDGLSLGQIELLAREAGMNYGAYVAMVKEAEK